MVGAAQKRKEVTAEPASDTRASTRTRTASSKQRELGKLSFFPSRAPHTLQNRHQDEQAETELQK